MVNVAAFSVAVVACFASFGAARNCTPNLYYCGSSLWILASNYYDDIEGALAATKQGICADRKHVKNSLFYCVPGTNGDIKYKGYCSKGCKNMGVGKSDKC
ncbi:hypothetical protein NW759_013879 [Fusarium solani]|nr:hypothetical protein NW759_013879 [Fusarium solani]